MRRNWNSIRGKQYDACLLQDAGVIDTGLYGQLMFTCPNCGFSSGNDRAEGQLVIQAGLSYGPKKYDRGDPEKSVEFGLNIFNICTNIFPLMR